MTFGQKIGALVRAKREAEGWSYAQLAIAIWGDDGNGGETRKGDAQRLEEGRSRKPNAATLKKLRDGLGITQAEIDGCRDSHEDTAIAHEAERLLAENEALRDQLKLSEALAVGLAYDYAASNPTDFDTAMRELRRAFEVAAETKDRGLLPANTDDAVNEVLRRVNDLNDRGERAEAAALISEEEARAEAGLLRLYQSGLDQAVLNRDAEAAAGYEVKKVTIEIPDPTAQFTTLRHVHDEWYERGRDKGLNFDLEVAISMARQCLARSESADQRGAAGSILGKSLQTLGARESGTGRLEEAVAVYRAALEERTRDRVPLDWARTQMNLGTALSALGERESGTDRLEEAVAAYRAALEERTRDRVPLEWAITQVNLGTALTTLGDREPGKGRLGEAVAAYRAALEKMTRDRMPLDWARTQMNLGAALQILGEREQRTGRLEEAVAAYRATLEEWTRDRVPMGWARAQMNLGNALKALGTRDYGTNRLEEAVAAYRAALNERTRDRVPLDWAMTQHNLAGAHLALFRKTGAPDDLDRAKDCALAAAEVFKKAGAGHYIALSESRLAKIDSAAGG